MTVLRKIHSKSFKVRPDLDGRLLALEQMIESLRSSALHLDSKKRMLNHAIWEVSAVRGSFTPEFRSEGVVKGQFGTKIQREHVYKRKQLVADILAGKEPLNRILSRVIHCVVTKPEHDKLSLVSPSIDGWERYKIAGIIVYTFRTYPPSKLELF
jgi:hypothetical protein